MNLEHGAKLEKLGLSHAEARVYLALLHHGSLNAAGIAAATSLPRTSVYPVLCSLADKGMVEGGVGHGSKFVAMPPDRAFSLLIAQEKRTLAEREEIAGELSQALAPVAADAESSVDNSVQVIRTPQVIGERLHRLQLEGKQSFEGFVKAPFLNPHRGNPAQRKAARRGVRYRVIYERAVVDDPEIGPYLQSWIASGEDARVYNGELPYKLAVFDNHTVMLILARRTGPSSALVVRHVPFAKSMHVLFETFWNQSAPLSLPRSKNARSSRRAAAALGGAGNNHKRTTTSA